MTSKNYCRCDYRRYKKGFSTSGITKVYAAWRSMRQRCNNPNCSNYHRYGGRGITYCDRWETFDKFFDDMGHPPSPELSLERIKNELGYSPDNCCWATQKQQNNNRDINVQHTAFGKTQTESQWAQEYGVSLQTLRYRLKHMPIEKALTLPLPRRLASWIRQRKDGFFQYYRQINGIRFVKVSRSLQTVLDYALTIKANY